ncbi:hypothetical protein FOXYSP1_15453 [Fusarium oxysporum f. sp. phaseoli]
MLFMKSKMGHRGTWLHLISRCFIRIWPPYGVRKQFLAERMKYLKVPLLPRGLGRKSEEMETR